MRKAKPCVGKDCKAVIHPDDERIRCSRCENKRSHLTCNATIDELKRKISRLETDGISEEAFTMVCDERDGLHKKNTRYRTALEGIKDKPKINENIMGWKYPYDHYNICLKECRQIARKALEAPHEKDT